MFEVTSL